MNFFELDGRFPIPQIRRLSENVPRTSRNSTKRHQDFKDEQFQDNPHREVMSVESRMAHTTIAWPNFVSHYVLSPLKGAYWKLQGKNSSIRYRENGVFSVSPPPPADYFLLPVEAVAAATSVHVFIQ